LKDIVPYIYAVLGGRLADQEWSDDIAQDVLMSVHKSLHTYDPGRPFKSWLTSIIHFRKTDYLRKHYSRKKLRESVLADVFYQLGSVTEQGGYSELQDIEKHLEKLSPKQKDAFIMMRVEGYSAAEVGQKLDMSESAVKVAAHRASKTIAKALTKENAA